MAELEFQDLKIGDGLRLNGYPMELLAVGNLLVADHQRVEIVILQKLEEDPDATPREYIKRLTEESGFRPDTLREIVKVAVDRYVPRLADLTDDEVLVAIGAIEAAIADEAQLGGGQ